MEWKYWLKLIITILTFALAAIEFDFFKKFQEERVKKRWIGFLFIALILFTIWDTTKDSLDNLSESIKKNSQIEKDSLRAEKIIRNLEKSIDGIALTKDEIIKVDSILNLVKDTLQGQVLLLNSAVSKSKELNAIEESKYFANSPQIIVFPQATKITIKDSVIATISYQLSNYGNRPAFNFKARIDLFYFNYEKKSLKNFESDTIFLKNDFVNFQSIPSSGKFYFGSNIKNSKQIMLTNNNSLIAVISTNYYDSNSRIPIINNIFIETKYFDNKNLDTKYLLDKNKIQAIVELFKEFNKFDLISKETKIDYLENQ